MKVKDKGSGKSQPICSNVDSTRKNYIYDLYSGGEQQSSPKVVTGILQVFSIDVYPLLDFGSRLSFVTPLIASRFDLLPNVRKDQFMVTTPVGESVVVKRSYVLYVTQ